MAHSQRRLTDPRELRALAHPVRMAIIELLAIDGPLTATELADRLGETPANCSWHLRKLAQFGFVEEAEGGTGRQRPWQVPNVGFSWEDEPESTPEERRAGRALSEVTTARAVERMHDAHRRTPEEPEEWRSAQNGAQTLAWLTAEELAELNAELLALLTRHVDRIGDPSLRPEGARLCELVAWGALTYFPGTQER